MKRTELGFKGLILTVYVTLWVSYSLLIRGSLDEDHNYPFNPLALIVVTEVVKAGLSTLFLAYQHGSLRATLASVGESWREARYFAIPAAIYAAYNSLSYINLRVFTPVEFKVLINLRVLLTGVTLHFCVSRRLSRRKWLALLFLFAGCVLNQLDEDFGLSTLPLHLPLMWLQAALSSLGGIYNEMLLKRNLAVPMSVKNIYLYLFSIVFNGLWIALAEPLAVSSAASFFRGFDAYVAVCIVVGSCCGLFTSLLLRYLDVILKEYAHSAEIFATGFISWAFFGLPIHWNMLVSLFVVTISVFIYNTAQDPQQLQQQPIEASTLPSHSKHDKE